MVSGIFSILAIAMGVTSVAVSCIEKDSLYKRIFSLAMMIVGIWYFIDFYLCRCVIYRNVMIKNFE